MNDGGPAFPIITSLNETRDGSTEIGSHGGMTLRDYFAAKAMQGFLARTADKYGGCTGADGLSTAAYSVADAMIAERLR